MKFVDYINAVLSNTGKFKDYKRITHIGERIKNRNVYKYMDIDTAINYCLRVDHNSIQFVQPTQWPDKYEERFYNASYSNILRKKEDKIEKTPRLYACCFTIASTSEAAWNTYSYNKTGRGSQCVQFKINMKKLRIALNEYADDEYDVYEGPVFYKPDYAITNLHFKTTADGNPSLAYQACFWAFNRIKYLALLLLKRDAFEYEKEVRFFLVPKDQTRVQDKIYPKIPYADIVEGVKVSDDCPAVYRDDLRAALNANGMTDIDIEGFDLYKKKAPRIIIGDKR